jgi:phage virion morphogenesis protein
MITIAIDDGDVLAALHALQAKVRDPSPALSAIGELLMESTKQRFALGVGPDGAAWAPNKPGTRKEKKGPRKPLIDTGILADTIHWQLIDGGQGVMVGSNRYAAIILAALQFGTDQAGRGHNITIPARPYLGLSAADKDAVVRVLQNFLTFGP